MLELKLQSKDVLALARWNCSNLFRAAHQSLDSVPMPYIFDGDLIAHVHREFPQLERDFHDAICALLIWCYAPSDNSEIRKRLATVCYFYACRHNRVICGSFTERFLGDLISYKIEKPNMQQITDITDACRYFTEIVEANMDDFAPDIPTDLVKYLESFSTPRSMLKEIVRLQMLNAASVRADDPLEAILGAWELTKKELKK